VVHDNLHRWDRTILKKPQKQINSIKKEVEELTWSELTEENIAREKELVAELEKLLEQEETYWAQRSWVNWLKLGDKNTSYFHNFASSRRSRNRIKGLRDQSGAMMEGTNQLKPMISDCFAGLFTTEVDEPDPDLMRKLSQG
jgi:hypothetical protein